MLDPRVRLGGAARGPLTCVAAEPTAPGPASARTSRKAGSPWRGSSCCSPSWSSASSRPSSRRRIPTTSRSSTSWTPSSRPARRRPTGKTYWLGTDDQGRDMLSGIFYGLRISLGVGIASTVFALAIGLVFGLMAAYFGGWVDTLIMRIVDIQLSLPGDPHRAHPARRPRPGRGQDHRRAGHRAVGLLRAHGALLGAGRAAEGVRRGGARAWPSARRASSSATCCPTACRRSSSWPPCRSRTRSRSRRRSPSSGLGLPITEPSLGLLISNGFQYLLSGQVLDQLLPGRGAAAHHHGHQPGGRPAARHPQPEASQVSGAPLLQVDGLRMHFFTKAGVVKAVDDVSFRVGRGEILGLVGESGSGKSMTGYSILGLVDPPGRIVEGRIVFDGTDLTRLDAAAWRRIRGNRIAMIFQDPMMTLNPVLQDRHPDRRGGPRARRRLPRERARPRPRGPGAGRASPRPTSACSPIRTSSPAACASAWRSPSRS